VIDWSSLPDFSAPGAGVDDVIDEGTIDEFGLPTFSVDAIAGSVRELGAAAGLDESAMWALLAIVGIGVMWSLTPANRAPAPAWE
jgi:hypothetical protein